MGDAYYGSQQPAALAAAIDTGVHQGNALHRRAPHRMETRCDMNEWVLREHRRRSRGKVNGFPRKTASMITVFRTRTPLGPRLRHSWI